MRFSDDDFSAIFEKADHSRLFVPQQEHYGVPRRDSEMIYQHVKFDCLVDIIHSPLQPRLHCISEKTSKQ